MNTKKFFNILMIFFLIICIFTSWTWAEDGTVNFGNREFTEDDVINVFTVSEPAHTSANTRGITPKRDLSVEIHFELDSHQLTMDAREKLDVMGRAINDEKLKSAQFIIEGHTDASGSTSYNQRLSERRAKSVKDYLVHQAKVSSDRLNTIGKGEHELLYVSRPYAPENRRVKFIMSGD